MPLASLVIKGVIGCNLKCKRLASFGKMENFLVPPHDFVAAQHRNRELQLGHCFPIFLLQTSVSV